MSRPKTFDAVVIAAITVFSFSYNHAASAAEAVVLLGTGGAGGVYLPAGRAICRLVNGAYAKQGLSCSAQPSKGSIANLKALRTKSLHLAIAQSDWQFHAYEGSAKFKKDGPFKDLRALFSLHAEPFTVVARADSGIKTFDDLQGKRVNVSNPGSGARGTMIEVMKVLGWRARTFSKVMQLDAAAQAKALCDGKIDVMVYTVGHPSKTISDATARCAARLIPVSGPGINALVKSRPYYAPVTIPAGLYKNNTHRVRTFGVGATVVGSTALSEAAAYKIVKAVFANLKKFKTLHPALKALNAQSMTKDGLSAPRHPGAVKYFKEAGLN